MALETKASRRSMETAKNRSRKKAVDLESGSSLGLKRSRKKIGMPIRLIRRKRLNGDEGFNPNRNHKMEIKAAGRIQPAMPRARYSFEVSCFPKMFFKTSTIRL